MFVHAQNAQVCGRHWVVTDRSVPGVTQPSGLQCAYVRTA